MYFIKRQGHVCHILRDPKAGDAPCGSKLDKLDLLRHESGKPSPRIVPHRPTDIPLCKHCRKVEQDGH